MNATELYNRHSRIINRIMVKQANRVTLNIPYNDIELANMQSRLESNPFNPAAKFLDITTGAALGSSVGTLGAILAGNEYRWPVIAALGAGAGGLALGIKGPYSSLLSGADKHEKKELRQLLSRVQPDKTIPVEFTEQQIENMRKNQNSLFQPKATRNYWKKVLKAYDEQIGIK